MVFLGAFGISGCDSVRARLASWRGERAERGERAAALPSAVGAYDCPPGVVRCVEGRLERALGGTVDGRTLERSGCPFERIDTCEGRCVDDEDHLEEELPGLCVGDPGYRARHTPPADAAAAEGDAAEGPRVESPTR